MGRHFWRFFKMVYIFFLGIWKRIMRTYSHRCVWIKQHGNLTMILYTICVGGNRVRLTEYIFQHSIYRIIQLPIIVVAQHYTIDEGMHYEILHFYNHVLCFSCTEAIHISNYLKKLTWKVITYLCVLICPLKMRRSRRNVYKSFHYRRKIRSITLSFFVIFSEVVFLRWL